MTRRDCLPTNLPSPAESPKADVVIYDGRCSVCSWIAQTLCRLDRRGRLAFLSLYDEEVARRYPDLSREELMAHVYVVRVDGRRHKGAQAVRYLSRRLPGLWWLAPLLHVPGSMVVWRPLYTLFARHRHWLTGARD